MKKLIVLLALLCLVPAAGAAETDSGIGQAGGALADALPAGSRAYLDGIQAADTDSLAASFTRLLENVAADSRSAVQGAARSLLHAAGIAILAAVGRGFSSAAGGAADGVMDLAA